MRNASRGCLWRWPIGNLYGHHRPARIGRQHGRKLPVGELCIWYLTGYSGAIADMYNNESNYVGKTFYNSTLPRDNNARSARSNSVWTVACLYENANYSGPSIARLAGGAVTGKDHQLSSLTYQNDRASSHLFHLGLLCNDGRADK